MVPRLSDSIWRGLHRSIDADGDAIVEILTSFSANKTRSRDVPKAIRFRARKRQIDQARQEQRRNQHQLIEEPATGSEGEPWRALELEEERVIVRRCIKRLTSPLRETCWLRWIEDASVREISERFNCPAKTIYDRLGRGRKIIKEDLKIQLEMERN